MRIPVVLLAVALATPLAAQLKVSVQATNAAGIALDRSNSTRAVQNHTPNQPFTTYSLARIYEQNPYAYLMSYVYPPYNYPNGPTLNRVMLTASSYVRKNSGHKSLHTTDTTKGDPGTQKFQVDIAVTGTKKVKIDWAAYGYIYDASTASVKFTLGAVTKTFNYTSGYNRDNSSFEVTVTNKATMNVEITGQCKPGTGGGGNTYYDGYYTYLSLNFLETGSGSFTVFGKGCAQGKIGAKGTPTKGSYFGVTLTGEKPNTSCALLWGYSKDYYQFIKLPLDLSYMGATGCFLNVGFVYPWYRTTDATGNAEAGVYLPWYASGTIYTQWLVWDPKNPTKTPTLTQGAEIKY